MNVVNVRRSGQDEAREVILPYGCLVVIEGCSLGVGKFLGFSPHGKAEIEWFTSVAIRNSDKYEVQKVRRACLPAQTRCYVVEEYDDTWRMGRVMGVVEDDAGTCKYEVHFPNKSVDYIPESRVYVRCAGPAPDPTETLACRAHETPFFHEARSTFVRSLVEQRAASRGLTGLISARIQLLPHQVEVVRRVLEDPIQRYLLADEVGLGKTIEAGVILRQVLLDDPSARALVLVPPFLEAQWRSELDLKLCLADDPRVQIRSVEEINRTDLSGKWGILVVDEAHHVAAAQQSPERQHVWKAVQHLARKAPRVILLSATPALNHEEDFLAMLHLLEPQAYDLGDLEAFRQRVQSRQPIGHFLLGFQEGIMRTPLRAALETLGELFPSDVWIGEQVDALRACLDAKPFERERANDLIRAIRVHICETYRIHRRMLRTARASITDNTLSLRSERMGATPVTPEYDFDERGYRVHEWIEEWRVRAATTAPTDETGKLLEAYSRTLVALLEACGTWIPFAAKAVRYRLSLIEQQAPTTSELDEALCEELRAAPSFPGEADILAALVEALEDESIEGDQINVLIQAIRQDRRRGVKKWVLFTSYTLVAEEIARRVRSEFGPASVATHLVGISPEMARKAVTRFREQAEPVVLVCDRSGEEGLNLQFAERLIHFDLPWQPNRIEQRIGRLDRIGRLGVVQARVFVGPDCDDCLYEAWFTLLSQGLGVFSASVSDLQFFIDRELPRIRQAALQNGATGVLDLLKDLQEGVQRERELLREQSSLDEIDAFDREASDLFQCLKATDAREAWLQEALEGWAVKALNMRLRVSDPPGGKGAHPVRYEARERCLLPSEWAGRLERKQKHFGTFSREQACRSPRLQFFRIGDPFVDMLADLVQWDDRGRAFVLYSHIANWSAGHCEPYFRMDYIVQTDLKRAREVIHECGWDQGATRALLRKADGWFPPETRTLFVDTELRVISDPQRIGMLSMSYQAADKGGCDYNLNHERIAVLDQVISLERWPQLCREVRQVSEGIIREDAAFRSRVTSCADRAVQDLELRMEQLRRGLLFRSGGLAGGNAEAVQALYTERRVYAALIEGIRNPSVRLDAVGFIILSGDRPSMPGSAGEE